MSGVFGWERFTGALLGRLTHRVHIVEMTGEGYRLRFRRQKAAAEGADQPDDTQPTSAPISSSPTLPSLLEHSASSHYSGATVPPPGWYAMSLALTSP